MKLSLKDYKLIMKKAVLVFMHFFWNNNSSSPQARTEFLRKKSRAALHSAGEQRDEEADDDGDKQSGGSRALEHLNLFPLEESSEKKGNEEYLKDKKDEQVRVLLLLTLSFSSNVFKKKQTKVNIVRIILCHGIKTFCSTRILICLSVSVVVIMCE